MAVAFDAATHADTAAASPLTWTHTPVGTPSSVVVGVFTLSGETVNAVTYGGQALTQITTRDVPAMGIKIEQWGLANPPSGAQTVSISTSTVYIVGAASTFTGSGTTFSAAFGAKNTATGLSGNAGGDLSGVQTGSLSVDMVGVGVGGTLAPAEAGQTERWDFVDGAGLLQIGGSTHTGTGTVTFSWTQTVDTEWLWSGVEVLAAGGPTPPQPATPTPGKGGGLNYSARTMAMAGL